MGRGLASVLDPADLTIVVNVGDDDTLYGVHVSPDVDTVVYTLAGLEGPHGWGRRGDTFAVMEELDEYGLDTSFRLGDRDLAMCLLRTTTLASGGSLSEFTATACARLEIAPRVLPVSDDPIRTKVQTYSGDWLDFQEYFVVRRHQDRVRALRFEGAEAARPAPGVIEAIEQADAVIIAPSNPPLSVWPMLAVPGLREAVAAKAVVAAVSPLFSGRALKGPAATVMTDLGLPPGSAGVLEAYEGLLSHLVVDTGDSDEAAALDSPDVRVVAGDTRIDTLDGGARFARELLDLIRPVPAPVR